MVEVWKKTRRAKLSWSEVRGRRARRRKERRNRLSSPICRARPLPFPFLCVPRGFVLHAFVLIRPLIFFVFLLLPKKKCRLKKTVFFFCFE